MELEFKIWLYFCKPEYLKLVNVTFFGKNDWPQLNLRSWIIYLSRTNHFWNADDQLDNFKTFILMTEIASLLKKWKRLHQNKKVILQTNEEVLTDSLHMTSITTPEAFQQETRNTSNTGSLFLNSKRKTEHQGHTNKNNTQDLFSGESQYWTSYTRLIFSKLLHSNTESQREILKLKEEEEITNKVFSLTVNFLSLLCSTMLDKYLEMHTSTISVASRREKHPPAQKMYISRGTKTFTSTTNI